jgi:hypothetical protein
MGIQTTPLDAVSNYRDHALNLECCTKKANFSVVANSAGSIRSPSFSLDSSSSATTKSPFPSDLLAGGLHHIRTERSDRVVDGIERRGSHVDVAESSVNRRRGNMKTRQVFGRKIWADPARKMRSLVYHVIDNRN